METTGRKLTKLKEKGKTDNCSELLTELCIFCFLAPVWKGCLNRVISSVPWTLRSCLWCSIHGDLPWLNSFWEMCVPRARVSKMYQEAALCNSQLHMGHMATPISTSFSWWETWLRGKDKKWMSKLGFTNDEGRDMQSHIRSNPTSMLAFTNNSSPNWLEVPGRLSLHTALVENKILS